MIYGLRPDGLGTGSDRQIGKVSGCPRPVRGSVPGSVSVWPPAFLHGKYGARGG